MRCHVWVREVREGVLYPGDVITLLPIWLCVPTAQTPASWPIFSTRRKATPKGMASFGREVVEPLQSLPMMACVSRGRLSLWPVFCTPPALPNALQRIQLG